MNTTLDAKIELSAKMGKHAWLLRYANRVHLANVYNLPIVRVQMDSPILLRVSVDFAQKSS